MPITPFFAAIFGVLYIMLSLNVVRHRLSKKISLGAGGDSDLDKAIRCHANFIEYVPLSLILFYFIETLSLSSYLVFYLGSALLFARVFHLFGMTNPKSFLVLRQIGSVVTFAVILIASIALAMRYLPVSI